MKNNDHLLLGKLGEDASEKYLSSLGYKIIERNFKKGYGEIDIVALEGDDLVFIEVKSRKGNAYGLPEEAMTSEKLHTLINTVNYYKLIHPELPKSIRIDLVAVNFTPLDTIEKITLYRNITQ
jgi:putative endonuclease